MKREMLEYHLDLVHPENHEPLLGPRQRGHSIILRTQTLPRVGDFLVLQNVKVPIGRRKSRRFGSDRTFYFRLQVVEVVRCAYITESPQIESGHLPFYEERTSFTVAVIPTTKRFDGTIRVFKKFQTKINDQWRRSLLKKKQE